MEPLDFLVRGNADYLDQLYQRYLADPHSVDEPWAKFFAELERAPGPSSQAAHDRVPPGSAGESKLTRGINDLVHSYRELGHFMAKLNPLGPPPTSHPLLDLAQLGYSREDLLKPCISGNFLGRTSGTLGGLIENLQTTYCGSLGVEYMSIADKAQRAWLQERMEPGLNRPSLTGEEKRRILTCLIHAEGFEQFLHTKYVGQKRFSLEGGEALIPLLDMIIDRGGALGVEEMVLGMAHRGRLNVLTQTVMKPYEFVLSEFEGTYQKQTNEGDGDVKYHLGYSCDRLTTSGKKVHCSLTPNPSHLELVDPIIEGIVRAKQQYLGDANRGRVVPILIHGEAAFAGQGIVFETLNLSELEGYRTGGTIHLIVNNQVGFTATAQQTRFTPYPTDVAKMIQAPIFHVNGDDPEAVIHAAKLAIEFRQQFKVDVLIDLWCFRKYGHNEADDPTFTQPLMYQKIQNHPSVVDAYAKKLIEEGVVTQADIDEIKKDLRTTLDQAQAAAREKKTRQRFLVFGGVWDGMTYAGDDWSANTAIRPELLKTISEGATRVPDDFDVHPKLKRLLGQRVEMGKGLRPVDWACGEMWALGSLLLEGTPVRLAGQDCERGTFSHRHAVLHDVKNGGCYAPLAHLADGQASFTILNTMLSELAVLGFEYGYSLADPRNLVMWEAQFGDFVNGAQPIIDQYISAGESKWQRMSGLTMLLPHGYEGQGPEHSSARLERFLQLCGDLNLQVAYPSVPAQYFHLLRRQIHRKFRKPLVLMMPKSLLRNEKSTSRIEDFTQGKFQPVMDDPEISDPESVKRVIFCSGKIYFTLEAARLARKTEGVAIVRVEQLYPFPANDVQAILSRYQRAKEMFWAQEEPQNMGSWTFIHPRLSALLPEGIKLAYAGREEAASPATGSFHVHQHEEEEILSIALDQPATRALKAENDGTKKEGSQAASH